MHGWACGSTALTICWQIPDPDRFSMGINGLADYMHGLGLKLGLCKLSDDSATGYNMSRHGHWLAYMRGVSRA